MKIYEQLHRNSSGLRSSGNRPELDGHQGYRQHNHIRQAKRGCHQGQHRDQVHGFRAAVPQRRHPKRARLIHEHHSRQVLAHDLQAASQHRHIDRQAESRGGIFHEGARGAFFRFLKIGINNSCSAFVVPL